MAWIKFTKASQAVKGARMRPDKENIGLPGRKKGYVVAYREQRPYEGNLIVFTDGNSIKLSDAKAWWLIETK